MAPDPALTKQFIEIRPSGGHNVILADPPWLFKNRSDSGEMKNANQHYDCMEFEDICAMPVEILAADDCALFLWCTWPMMPRWNELIEAWGFDYAGIAWEWIKYNAETGKYAFGLGYGTRKNLEPCLLATRGNPSLRKSIDLGLFGIDEAPDGVHSVRDWMEEMPSDCIRSKAREHSRKPDQQYPRIETMFAGPRIELFTRTTRPGWSCWGNEVGKFEEVTI